MRYSIFTKESEKAMRIVDKIYEIADNFGCIHDEENPDLIFFVGGDGTFLRAVQDNLDRLDEVSFVGINAGTLGFSYDFSEDEIYELFEQLDAYNLKEKEIPLIKGKLFQDYDEFIEFYAVNEIRLTNIDVSLECDISINKESLERFVGNGVVVSTAFGSSGLNKSLGGALISHDLNALEITPLAPVNNKIYTTIYNPIIIPSEDAYILFSGDFSKTKVSFDHITLDEKFNHLLVTSSPLKVRVLVKKDNNYIKTIRKNMLK